jgi:hypothetical protein
MKAKAAGQILWGEDEEEVEGVGSGRVGANCGSLLHGDALGPARESMGYAEEPPPPQVCRRGGPYPPALSLRAAQTTCGATRPQAR